MRATLASVVVLALVMLSGTAETALSGRAETAPQAGAAQTKGKTLDIYVLDVEGGKATLFVSPTGETVLLDSANPQPRDTERIMAALAEAGVKEIDYLVSTHYHVDHIGGMQELAKRVPIKTFVDHGPTSEEREQIPGFQAAYAELRAKAKHIVVKPGDKLPIAGIDWQIVTAGGKAISKPLPGGGRPNPACADFKKRDSNPTDENGQSVGSVISFGKFRTIDLGDLLWNNEYDFMCPNNLVGPVDLYLVSHHGTDPSGSPALVHGLQPRVAISQNGTRKGGTLQTAQTLNSSPNLQDHWQLHWSYNVGTEWNPAGIFIANIDEPSVIATILTSPPPVPGAGRGGPPPSTGGPVPSGTAAPATSGPIPAGSSGGTAPPMPTPSSTGPPVPASTTPVPAPAGAPASGPPQPPTIGAQTPTPATSGGQPGGPVGNRGGGGGRGGGHTGPAFWIKVSAQADGTFTITNTRNGFSRTYRPR